MKVGDIVVLPSHLKNPMTVTRVCAGRVGDMGVYVELSYFDHEGRYGSASMDSAVLLPYQPKGAS